MIIPRRNTRIRRWVAGLLLAAYGSAGVLGYGLHAVWECDHHCHEHSHAKGVAHSHSHDHGHVCHHHHDHEPVVADHGDHHTALNLAAEDCPICEFLAQAQSPFALEVATDCTGPTYSILSLLDTTYVAPLSGVHCARGPPIG